MKTRLIRDPLTPWSPATFTEHRHMLDVKSGRHLTVGIRRILGTVYAFPLGWDHVSGSYVRNVPSSSEVRSLRAVEMLVSEILRQENIYLVPSGVSNLPHRPRNSNWPYARPKE